ncbi:MAG TPA: ribonuclease P protein component [Hyphomicrobium sp.]|uniref:ribonuclease P protein component n=1 Tax=Hyphomicrobium sp. TaxID=82 RepID=UPI002C653C22|nr:ribonuclease P protein component [Hyphomicrobium sp.]HRN87647.1 ribonuclease P protein component [Hyphomicrobium sp.]
MAIETLKKRAEFLRIRGGARFATPSFVLETKPRGAAQEAAPTAPAGDAPRFGFTVTKKLGKAVDRNRIRRRLKAAVGLLAPSLAHRGHDYVLIARAQARDRAFTDVKKDLERAFLRVHHAPAASVKGRSA